MGTRKSDGNAGAECLDVSRRHGQLSETNAFEDTRLVFASIFLVRIDGLTKAFSVGERCYSGYFPEAFGEVALVVEADFRANGGDVLVAANEQSLSSFNAQLLEVFSG